MKAPQRILVPTDFSQYADKALEQALLFAKQFNAQIYLLHVVQDIQQCGADYCLSEEWLNQYRLSSVNASKQKLRNEVEKYAEARGVQITADVKVGTPYEEILKEEQEKKIDLIVIASHGKTGFLQHLIGSVADRVSHGAKSQVLLVKA